MQVLKRQLVQKDGEIDELRTISMAWMCGGGGGASGGRGGHTSSDTRQIFDGKEVGSRDSKSESYSQSVLERVYRGCRINCPPACISLFFRKLEGGGGDGGVIPSQKERQYDGNAPASYRQILTYPSINFVADPGHAHGNHEERGLYASGSISQK